MAGLTIFVTLYGVLGALSSLLQVRRMLFTRSSDDVSVLFLIIYCGGYIVWLVYGLIVVDVALIIVDLVGMAVSLTTLTVALRLRMVEKGQTLWESMRDEAGGAPPELEWLGTTEDPVKKTPDCFDMISFNRCYPVMTLVAGDCRPELKRVSKIKLDPEKQKLFIDMVLAWRAVDSPDASEEDYAVWRESLAASLDCALAQPARPGFLAVANHELTRPEGLAPTGARLSECRAVSLMSASIALENKSGHLRFARAEQFGAHRIDALSQRWAEQSLGLLALSETTKPRRPAGLKDILTPLAPVLNPSRPVLLADENWQALLWTAGAGADKPLFGGPDPLPHPVVPRAWIDGNMACELRRLLLLAHRPRANERIMSVSPLDRSINEGWASLCQLLYGQDLGEEILRSLYPLERSFVSACARQAGLSDEGIIKSLSDIEVADSAQALAGLVGLSEEHLREIYQRYYLRIAQAVLSDGLTPLTESRLTASWRAALAQ